MVRLWTVYLKSIHDVQLLHLHPNLFYGRLVSTSVHLCVVFCFGATITQEWKRTALKSPPANKESSGEKMRVLFSVGPRCVCLPGTWWKKYAFLWFLRFVSTFVMAWGYALNPNRVKVDWPLGKAGSSLNLRLRARARWKLTSSREKKKLIIADVHFPKWTRNCLCLSSG